MRTSWKMEVRTAHLESPSMHHTGTKSHPPTMGSTSSAVRTTSTRLQPRTALRAQKEAPATTTRPLIRQRTRGGPTRVLFWVMEPRLESSRDTSRSTCWMQLTIQAVTWRIRIMDTCLSISNNSSNKYCITLRAAKPSARTTQ